MRVIKVLPREVEVIACDGPDCESWCESPDPTLPVDVSKINNRDYVQRYGAGCGWLALPRELTASIPSDNHGTFRGVHDLGAGRKFRDGEPAYFCSWECLTALVNCRATANHGEPAVVSDNPYDVTTSFHELLPKAS